jgi:outer membrane lipoprotein-sorting protein
MHKIRQSLIAAVILSVLLIGPAEPWSSGEPESSLSGRQILEKAEEAYASLTSYSDEGNSVQTTEGKPALTQTFHIRLGRPKYSRIEWQGVSPIALWVPPSNPSRTKIVWSTSEGVFDDTGEGKKTVSKRLDVGLALLGSLGAIPNTFFDSSGVCSLISKRSIASEKQQADEKVGGVDCYVFSESSGSSSTDTIWIGKQDFLIHQTKFISTSEDSQATTTTIEIHTNIVVNPKLSSADFLP